MRSSRRQFISRSALGSFGLVAAPYLASETANAGESPPRGTERTCGAFMSGYHKLSPEAGAPCSEVAWVDIDLGEARRIDGIRLCLSDADPKRAGPAPTHFCIDCSVDRKFGESRPFALWDAKHPSEPVNQMAHFPREPMTARYIRVGTSVETSMNSDVFTSRIFAVEILSGGSPLLISVQKPWATPRRGTSES